MAAGFPFIHNKRVTYVVDKAGIVRGVYHHEIAFGRHKDDVIQALRTLNPKG